MYKISQDHLALFFSAVRACGGWNNNPTTRQFTMVYKQLLMRHIIGGRGNCTRQADTEILNSVQDQCEIGSRTAGISDVTLAKRYDFELREPEQTYHDYNDAPN